MVSAGEQASSTTSPGIDHARPDDAIASASPSKLELEIQKLTGELQHQSAQAQLTIEKLRLESAKLQSELSRATIVDPLSHQKLLLDIRELKRSPWLRPGTIIPLAATVGTILFAQFQGVFDVAQRRLELSNTQLKIDSARLTEANEQLSRKREVLDGDIRKLAVDREQLQQTLQSLRRDKQVLEEKVRHTTLQLDAMGKRLQQVQHQARAADEKARTSYPAFRNQVLSDVYARVKSSCREATMPLYVDHRVVPAQLEVRSRPAESPLLQKSRSDCIRQTVESIESTHKLEPNDRATLEENIQRLASQIEDIRVEAISVYADARLTSKPWTLGLPLDAPLGSTLRDSFSAKQNTQPLPSAEPQRSQWIEWRRRYLVELHYLNQTNGLLGTDWLKFSSEQ